MPIFRSSVFLFFPSALFKDGFRDTRNLNGEYAPSSSFSRSGAINEKKTECRGNTFEKDDSSDTVPLLLVKGHELKYPAVLS